MSCCDKNEICDIQKTLSDVKKYERRIKNDLFRISNWYTFELKNAYSGEECRSKEDKKIDKLSNYLNRIDELKKQMIIGSHLCLDNEGISKFLEKIDKLIGKSCRDEILDYHYDDSKEYIWLNDNPLCVSYEEWNKWAKLKVLEWGLDLTSEEIRNDLLIELSAETIHPEILITAKVINEINELDIHLSSKGYEELKYELELLREDLPSARNIDIDLYTELYENNISIDVIRKVYENDLRLGVSTVENKQVIELITSTHKYPINDIKVNISIEELDDDMKEIYKELMASYNKNI